MQALDRTQPSLPMVPGRAQTMTHDYKRHGTTTLFAALNVLTGHVIGSCLPRHRHEEFLKFLRTIDREVPKALAVHMILDNYATHKHPERESLAGKPSPVPPAFHPDLLVLAEPGRAVVPGADRQGLRRGVFHSVPDLIAKIEDIPQRAQRQGPDLRLDSHRRTDPGQGRPRTGRTGKSQSMRDTPLIRK